MQTFDQLSNYDNIPASMRDNPRWVCHCRKPSDTNPNKLNNVPWLPSGKGPARSNEPADWTTFEKAKSAVASARVHGITYVLVAGDGLACIDLDGVRNAETGEIKPEALDIVKELNSYTEISPSGTGLHIWVKGSIPKASHKGGSWVELYADKKAIATTGNVFLDNDLNLYGALNARDLTSLFERAEAGEFSNGSAHKTAQGEKANGVDPSKVDFALACKLAREFNCDLERVRTAFLKQSKQDPKKLKRSKYIDDTLKNAIADVQAQKAKQQSAPSVVLDEPNTKDEADALPEFPRLPGALGQLIDSITPDLPYDHKAIAALTYMGIGLAKRVSMEPDHWLQTRFYVCMVGPAGSAKSAAEFEVRRALCEGENPVLSDTVVELSIDSGPALVQALEENPRLVLAPDELADQFEKARAGAAGRNSLFGELLRLFESNETANRTRQKGGEGGKVEIRNGLLALIGGTTTQRFPEMFVGTGANASGLQSRFVLSYSEKPTPRWKTPNDAQGIAAACAELRKVVAFASDAATSLRPLPLKFSASALEEFMAWRKDDDGGTDVMRRLLDQAKRFAMIVAACQNAPNIDADTMRLALQFADYQLALRAKLFPPDASSTEQMFENLVLAFLEKHCHASEAVIQNRIGPERRRGGYISFSRAWNALLRTGKVQKVGVNRSDKPVYALRDSNLQGELPKTL